MIREIKARKRSTIARRDVTFLHRRLKFISDYSSNGPHKLPIYMPITPRASMDRHWSVRITVARRGRIPVRYARPRIHDGEISTRKRSDRNIENERRENRKKVKVSCGKVDERMSSLVLTKRMMLSVTTLVRFSAFTPARWSSDRQAGRDSFVKEVGSAYPTDLHTRTDSRVGNPKWNRMTGSVSRISLLVVARSALLNIQSPDTFLVHSRARARVSR